MTRRQIPSLERCPAKVDGLGLGESLADDSREEEFLSPELLTRKLVIEAFSVFRPNFLGLVSSLDGENEGEEFFRLSKEVELSEKEGSISEFWEDWRSICFFFRLVLGLGLKKGFSSIAF